jgi:hypothetical protein
MSRYLLPQSPGELTVVTLAYASTINTQASLADVFRVVLTGNTTLANPTPSGINNILRWYLFQDSVGGHTVTLGSKFSIPDSMLSPLPFSFDPNTLDVLTAIYDEPTDKWNVLDFQQNYAVSGSGG